MITTSGMIQISAHLKTKISSESDDVCATGVMMCDNGSSMPRFLHSNRAEFL